MPEIVPYKRCSTLAAFSFLFGLVFSMTGVLYAMIGKVTRYSEPEMILSSCTLVGLGLVLTLAGVNFGGMKQRIKCSISFIAGILLAFAGLVIFLSYYPDNWFYPTVAYALISYSLGIFLLLINIFVNYYITGFWPLQCCYPEVPEDHGIEESSSEKAFMKDNSVMKTFAGILLTNLLPEHPGPFLYKEDEENVVFPVTIEGNEDGISREGHEAEHVGNFMEENMEDMEDMEDIMGMKEETVQEDSSGNEDTKEDSIEEAVTDATPASVEERTGHTAPFSEFVSMKKTNVKADDTMRQAARKILKFHFGAMIGHERGTKLGKDTEELHDMRVAAMRMRSVVEVLERYLDMKEMASHLKDIKATRKVLGTVRDLDVFLEKIDHYLEGQPPERRNGMDPLTDSILIERAKGRGNMLMYLDDPGYNKFKEKFAGYLSNKKSWKMRSVTKDGEPVPCKVKDVLPVLLYTQFAAVRAYDEVVSGEAVLDPSLKKYHQLRIDVKILRYTLEFFSEVLGPESKELINNLKALQDNLGDMHDTVVALELLQNFEKYGRWGETDKKRSPGSNELQDYPGVDAYIEFRKQELQDLLAAFPEAWSRVIGPGFSVNFSRAVSGIYSS
ncbi:MAG: CHAD domain-containing protein [Methanosarcinaceae archaeon]|nr:CHAD domain-containing protein [Methanosarcinaceae archaeon]